MESSPHAEGVQPLARARPSAGRHGASAGSPISRGHVPCIDPEAADQAPRLDAPGRVRAASPPRAGSPDRRHVAAGRLCRTVLGRDLSLTERARLQSSAAVASVARQARRTSRTVADHLSPTAAVAAAIGLGAAGAACPSEAAGMAQQAIRFAPALLPGAALYAGAALAGHFLPTEALSALERIGQGPHAESLDTLVCGLLASRPGDEEAVRATVLASLTELEWLVQTTPAPPVRRLLEGVLTDALTVGDVATSTAFFREVLPAVECLVDLGAEAAPWLNLLRNLLGPDAEPVWRTEPRTAGLAAFNALADAQASGLAGLIHRLCPLVSESGRANDRLLNGLVMIAAGVKAKAGLGFLQARLEACPDAPALSALCERLADAMPTLRAMAHSAMGPPVLRAFDHVVAGAADRAAPAALQLALLEQIEPLRVLFRQLPGAASAASSIAFDQKRVPRIGVNDRDLSFTAGAAIHLASAPRLCELLGLTTPEAAVAFWLSKAADRTLRS